MENRLRVLLAGPMPPPTIGGLRALIETWLSSSLPELVSLNTFDIGEPPDSYVPGRIGPRRLVKLMQQLLAFYREIRKFRPQIIHIHAPGGRTALAKASTFLLIGRWQRIPTIFHVHFWADDLCLLNSRWPEKVMIRVIAQANTIVPVSEEISSYLRRDLPASTQMKVMQNCIDLRDWNSLEKIPSSTIGVQLLFLGTMIGERKGQMDLVQAYARSDSCSKSQLVLVGGDRGTGDLNRVKALAQELGLTGHCQFLGPVYGQQKRQVIVDSDIFVLPSYAEGQPISLLEAMAAGLPIIASNIGTIADVVKEGENGILVEPGDIRALADAIDGLVHNESMRRRMGERSRQLAHQYDVKPYLRRLLQVYESVAKKT